MAETLTFAITAYGPIIGLVVVEVEDIPAPGPRWIPGGGGGACGHAGAGSVGGQTPSPDGFTTTQGYNGGTGTPGTGPDAFSGGGGGAGGLGGNASPGPSGNGGNGGVQWSTIPKSCI